MAIYWSKTLIDRAARNRLAESMRALASGLISNDEFEDKRLPHSANDTAIFEVYSNGAWSLYSDLQEYRLSGRHKLDSKSRSEVARWVLFLKTNLPYEWPVTSFMQWVGMLLANLVTLGFANRWFKRHYRSFGDVGVWPFIRRSDYEVALQNPPYLIGEQAS